MLAATLSLTSSSARAGIRDLAKKAKGTVTAPATAQQPPRGAPQFDDTMLELTGDLLDKLLACHKPAEAIQQELKKLRARQEAIRK